MEVSSTELIERIFAEEPKNPNSIELSFITQMDLKDLFEFLLTFFTEGSKKIYGEPNGKVDITKWNDEDIQKMKKYCQSIGFNLMLELHNKNDMETYTIDFNKMNYKNLVIDSKTVLNEFKLPLNFQDSDFICVIYFDYFQNNSSNSRCL